MASEVRKVPTFAELVEIGANDIRVWAIEFDPPAADLNSTNGRNRPKKWKGCIACANHSRPMITAIRATAKEADEDVRLAYWQHYAAKPHVYPEPVWQPDDFPMKPEAAKKAAPKPPAKPARRAVEDLI